MTEYKLNEILKSINVLSENRLLYMPFLISNFEIHNFDDENILYFIANSATETGNFSSLVEGLSYSAERLLKVFPSMFKNIEQAKEYQRNPEKLANYVYNSNLRTKVASFNNYELGDGFKYRGRGFLQTTGKNSYKILSEITGIDFLTYPELLEDPEYAVESGIIYYTSNKLDKLYDLKKVRRGIAGSYFGYEDHVLPNYRKMKNVL